MKIERTNRLELNTLIKGKIISSGTKINKKRLDKKTVQKFESYGCDIEFIGSANKPLIVSFIADPKIDVGSSLTATTSDESTENLLTKFTRFCLGVGVITEQQLIDEEDVEETINKGLDELKDVEIECSLSKNEKGYYQLELDSLKRVNIEK